MSRRLIRPLLAAIALSLLALGAASYHAATAATAPTYYLALGDSLAYGYQPTQLPDTIFFPGPPQKSPAWSGPGYAERLFSQHLAPAGVVTQLVNLACPGEDTATYQGIGGSICPYRWLFAPRDTTAYTDTEESQQTAADTFIRLHAGQVRVVTIDLGANDILNAFNNDNCAFTGSVTDTLHSFITNDVAILSDLRNTLNTYDAGQYRLVTMDYYQPYENLCLFYLKAHDPAHFPANYLAELKQFALFNATLTTIAAKYFGLPVAHVFTDFGGFTTVPNPHISGGGGATWTWMDDYAQKGVISPTVDLPAPSANYDCTEGIIFDLRDACIHLNASGARVVCGAFWAAYSNGADTPCAAMAGDVPAPSSVQPAVEPALSGVRRRSASRSYPPGNDIPRRVKEGVFIADE